MVYLAKSLTAIIILMWLFYFCIKFDFGCGDRRRGFGFFR